MMNDRLTPELQLKRENIKRRLEQNPEEATTLALNLIEEFLELSGEVKRIEQQYRDLLQLYQVVVNNNHQLTSQLIEIWDKASQTDPTLPLLLKCHRL